MRKLYILIIITILAGAIGTGLTTLSVSDAGDTEQVIKTVIIGERIVTNRGFSAYYAGAEGTTAKVMVYYVGYKDGGMGEYYINSLTTFMVGAKRVTVLDYNLDSMTVEIN